MHPADGEIRDALSEEQIDELIRALPKHTMDMDMNLAFIDFVFRFRSDHGIGRSYQNLLKEALVWRDPQCRAVMYQLALAWAKQRLES